MLFRRTCKLVEYENATKALEKAKPKNQEMVRFWQTCALHLSLIFYMWFSVVFFLFFFLVIHMRLHLAIDSKFKLSFWIIMVNTRIEVFYTFFYFQLQKAKDDAEEAYNSISEAAKKEVNKMI